MGGKVAKAGSGRMELPYREGFSEKVQWGWLNKVTLLQI